jgi:hypothetical protein
LTARHCYRQRSLTPPLPIKLNLIFHGSKEIARGTAPGCVAAIPRAGKSKRCVSDGDGFATDAAARHAHGRC